MDESARQQLIWFLEDHGVVRNCLNCEHFSPSREICTRWDQRPPAHIIARGCPDWEQEIPF